MIHDVNATVSEGIFSGGGEMGTLMRSHNWAATPLGSAEQWPQSLKTAVRIMLTSRQAMFVWWGEELINLYNDAYKAILGGKHPEVLGQPASYVWREIWDQVGPRAASAILNNEGTYDEALLLIMERNGYPEETYYTFSYSPVPNDQGGTGGIICANTDDTQRIIGERQLALLRELAARTADARTFDDACTRSAKCLETNPYDLPFAMIYLVDPSKEHIDLAGTCGIEWGHAAVPETITLDSDSPWPFAEVIASHKPCLVTDLEALFGSLPTGAWQKPPHQAVIVPIAPSGQTGKAGILVAGLNPFRLFDDNYQGFIDLVAAQIAASIANAQAYEEERKRAEALAELDQAKTIFFSNISHEFRTPLTLMLGPLEDMLANPAGFSPSEREQLETAHRNSLRLLKLVNTLLDFSRIEAGRVQAVYEPTDLARLTTDLAGMFRSAIERAGMRLCVDCPPLPEPIYIDREMWEKIVLNLLSNAFKFTLEGEITVALHWADDHVELEIRDTGTGIPAEEIPHLFERFHRVQGARGRTYEGSGIGLSLVQELVKLHSGTIQVSSVVDQGSCFTVFIPTGYVHIPSDRISTTRTLASTAMGAATYVEEALRWLPEESRGSIASFEEQGERIYSDTDNIYEQSFSSSPAPSARILLADDNADMRDYVKRLLLSQGYAVQTVVDGVAALITVRQQLPDLVLTDVMMPGIDGLGLLRELRVDPRTREIPIILLSARAGEESRIEGLEAGADDYLIKPFSARELLARVEATLKLAQMRQEATRREQELRIVSEAARSAAQSAQANLERVLASINDQFLVLDREWRYTYVNDRVVEATGISKEDLLGNCIWDVFPNMLESEFYIKVHRAWVEQTVVQFEYYYSSWQRWFENRVYPSASGVSILVTETTDRKQAEVALRQSEERFQAFMNNSPAAAWITDTEGRIVYLSQTYFHIFNFPTDDAIGKSIFELYPTEIAHQFLDNIKTVAQTNQVIEAIETAPRSNGTIGDFLVYKFPITDGSSGQRLVGGVAIDITERKQAEKALRQSEERYRYLTESIPQLVWTANAAGVLLDVNQRWLDFTGLTLAQAQIEGWQAIIHPDDVPILTNHWSVAQQDGSNYQAEGRMRRGDGVYRWHLHQAVPLKNESGQVIKWFGTATDIEDQKRLEQQRELLLQQEQAAREAAEQANRIKDEFLAVLSHELRSPLNPILGWSRLLQTQKLDEAKTTQALATIERNAKLQAELITDLLDVSRILQGKLSLNVYPVDLISTIQSAMETVRLAAEAKSIQIQTQLEPNVGQVSGDASRLQQVIWNLLSNAVKFTPQGGRVEIHLKCIGSQAQITVSDTGRGISPEFLPYVFDYFRQADATTTRKFGGLGLGLAIVRHLVELHGGTVQAESPGERQGATFTLRLPLIPTQPNTNLDSTSFEPSLDLQEIKVLVVDDDADAREFVAFLLEQYGASVTVVGSASEALIALTQSKPDVLLSDIGMPEIDGYMLLRKVRTLPLDQGGGIPAIALTAYAGEIDHQQALSAGFQMHVPKPIDSDHLVEVVANLVGQRISSSFLEMSNEAPRS